MQDIVLNVFPVRTDQFTITLYRLPYVEGTRPTLDDEQAVCRSLKIDDKWDRYWTLFQHIEDSAEVVCKPFDNIYVTIDALRVALFQSCQCNLKPTQFCIVNHYHRRSEIVVATYPEGSQVVSLEPYFLRSRQQFGFLADFRFHPAEGHHGTQRVRQLSLSLDKHGQPNRNYYADRYTELLNFVKKFHSHIFPLTVPGGHKVDVGTHLMELAPEKLDIKHYVVGSSRLPVLIIRVYNSGLEGVLGSGGFDAEAIHGGVSSG